MNKFLQQIINGLSRIAMLFCVIGVIGPLYTIAQQPIVRMDGPSETIRIGQFTSLTGGIAIFGQAADKGVRMAVDEINARGGLLGKKIELITEDTKSQTWETQNAVEKLIGRDKVVALIGEVASSHSIIAARIAEREKIPMLTPASTNEKVTMNEKTGHVLDHVFRICFIDPFQGTAMAKFAVQNLRLKRVAVLKDYASDYSVGVAKNFIDKFTAMGGQIVEEQAYEGGEDDFKTQLTAIKAKKPDGIFIPGYYTEVSLIATQARALGIKVPLLGGDGWDSPVLTQGAAGKALENSYFTNQYSDQDTSTRVQEFVKRYEAKFHETAGAMSALGYDAMMAIAHVIEEGRSSASEDITRGLAHLKNFPGVTGDITINDRHDAVKPCVILKIKKGQFNYYATVKP